MRKDVKTFIEHILECIELIEEYTKNKTEEDFLGSIQLQDAVIRRMEIIGEAVKNIPDEVKEKYELFKDHIKGVFCLIEGKVFIAGQITLSKVSPTGLYNRPLRTR